MLFHVLDMALKITFNTLSLEIAGELHGAKMVISEWYVEQTNVVYPINLIYLTKEKSV